MADQQSTAEDPAPVEPDLPQTAVERVLLQALEQGVLRHRQGRVLSVNPAFLELIQLTADEVLGGSVLDFLALDELPMALRTNEVGPVFQRNGHVLCSDGQRLPVRLIEQCLPPPFEEHWLMLVDDLRAGRAQDARLHFLSHHDALTGLPNRGTFLAQAESAIQRAGQAGQRLALLFVDLDHFKRVNDSLGHLVGDTLLKTLAERITRVLRVTDLVGRFAGDEFAVLLGGSPEREAVEDVARKLLATIETPVKLANGPSISTTASIGIALYPGDSQRSSELLQQADTASLHAKARGRSRHAFFDREMASAAFDALWMESDLSQALREGQFELAYQPQVRAGDGALVGYEALVRWRHPQRGWVRPDDFIPLAEQRRLMLGIGHWVLDEALRQTMRWRDQGLLQPDVRVGVNLSAMQFQGQGFVAWVKQALLDNGADPGCLELELTERMIMDDLPDGQVSLEALRQLGVTVALDDFGTGMTSLSQLKTLKVDRLKIDQSFVKDLPADPASAAVAEAIIRLAVGLKLDVVAEGVENQAQWEWLASRGCPQAQGHHISVPMPAAGFEGWLRQRLPSAA